MMNRRTFVTGLGAVLVAPLGADAQQTRVFRVAYVIPSQQSSAARIDAFRAELRQHGYLEGTNLVFEIVSAEGQTDRLDEVLRAAVRNVDVLVTSFTAAAFAAKRIAGPMPIVTAGVVGPVEGGLVESLARPNGNITGVTYDAAPEMGAKRLQILKEAVPQMRRLVALWNVDSPGMRPYLAPMQEWERRTGVRLQVVEANSESDVATALRQIALLRPDAMLVVPTAPIASRHSAVLDFAREHRLPTMGTVTWWTQTGGLLSYAVADRELDRRAAAYVDRILKGAKPGDMPMEQPTQFELVINLKTAKALGLTIPQSLLLRADQVIE
jgi:ABC-type uncharacterized transport system substrate-binding protein